AGTSSWVIARNVGTAVRGSTMKRTDVKIRNSSWSVFTIRSERHLHDAVLASALGFVHRLVGLAEQLVGPRFRPRHRHDADTGGHGRGAAEHGADAARESQGRGVGHGAVGPGLQDRRGAF